MTLSISIVTPNLNMAHFLSETIRSVLAADHGALDYIVVDGGSDDGSLDVIEGFRSRLSCVISEPDAGPYDAVNKGFARARGGIMAWLNAGDLYFPETLRMVSDIFETFPEISWLTSRVLTHVGEGGKVVAETRVPGYTKDAFLKGDHLPGWRPGPAVGFIQQESTFWRRSLWQEAGGRLDTAFDLAADFDLWARFFRRAPLYAVDRPLGGFRVHDGQRSTRHRARYMQQAAQVLAREGAQRTPLLATLVRVGARRYCPRFLRPAAHRLGLFAPSLTVTRPPGSSTWLCRME